ncbi:MAG: 6-phosphofructokinase, partial [Acidobacteriota bacterium]
MNQQSIAIFCGGGPAPGINTVISSVARPFLTSGYRVIGVHDGFKGLLSPAPDTVDIDFDYADRIFSLGGSSLRMSRFKPKESDFTSAFFKEHNIKLLVSIGGDDTASSASRLADFLAKEHLDVRAIHVPKTIDND